MICPEYQILHYSTTNRDGYREYKGGDIRLISCETGKSGALAAQGLANKLGVNVLAPTDVVYVFGDGRMIVSSDGYTNDGEWVVFEPANRLDGGGK